MNHDCNGDFYQIGKTRFYRCFLDSTVFKASRVGATCPRCLRTIRAQDHGIAQTKRETITDVKLGDLGWVRHQEPQA